MAWDVAVEVLLPKRGVESIQPAFRQSDPDSLWVRYAEPGAFRDGLNATGWFDDEVVAAGMVTQGRAQSLLGAPAGVRPRSRGELELAPDPKLTGGTLYLPGLDGFPVSWDGEPDAEELVELLAR